MRGNVSLGSDKIEEALGSGGVSRVLGTDWDGGSLLSCMWVDLDMRCKQVVHGPYCGIST